MAKRTRTRFSARMIPGSQPGEMPGFVKPQLATLREKAPRGVWLHEVKFDGYRIQTHLNKGRATLYTRNGLDWTKRLRSIANCFDIPVERAIFDGELVVVENGRTNFSELQAELTGRSPKRLSYYIFDLLYLDGFDLRKSPLIERKRVLKMLFDETGLSAPIFYSEHFEMEGSEMFRRICDLNMEGIISKNPAAPYRSDRSEAWIKVKCVQRGKFPIVGFIPDVTALRPCIWASRKGKSFCTRGRSARAFRTTRPWTFERSSNR